METERVTGFPLTNLDRRPRKRARLGWDVLPEPPKVWESLSLYVFYVVSRIDLLLFIHDMVFFLAGFLYFRAQLGLFCGQDVGNVTSYASSRQLTDLTSAPFTIKGVAQNGSPPRREDDKDGHFVFELGENLTPRYKIHSKMGEGTFGQVLECWDRERKEMVAIKIVRGMKKYRDAAMIEVEMLQQLGKHDNGNRCVQIWNWFDYRNHICIVFEKLGPSLYDFLRKNNYRSFPIDLVREIGRQLLDCVAFMHDLRLIHTDLKPENILLISPEYVKVPDYKVSSRSPKDGSYYKRIPKSSAIKVIDFGSTTYDRQNQTYVVSTRHYRAPEVILGLGWTYPCDIWSVGCILVELCSGEALFQTHENLEHLAMMEKVLGPLPQHMLKRVDRQAEKYVRRGRLDWPEGATSRDSIRAVLKLARLQNIIMQHVDHSAGDLINLLQGLLRYDPSERLTAREALRHPFFTRDHLRR
uniref:dual-specificity kinase n=2 Tax=Solanum subgen. Lycopersicon TaxID=49274 RepID=A0A3Q7FRB1_SOLLC